MPTTGKPRTFERLAAAKARTGCGPVAWVIVLAAACLLIGYALFVAAGGTG
jgi:hypothetical protein